MDSPLECLGLRQTMGFAISRESELGFGTQASTNGHMRSVIHLRNTTAEGATLQACARCVQAGAPAPGPVWHCPGNSSHDTYSLGKYYTRQSDGRDLCPPEEECS